MHAGDGLIAVLSQFSIDQDERAGRWFLECGFAAAVDGHVEFIEIASTCIWIEHGLAEQMARQPPVRTRS